MSPRAEDFLEQARKLTAEGRRELAIQLLEAEVDPAIEQAWAVEVERRISEVESGEVETVPHDEAWRMITSDD